MTSFVERAVERLAQAPSEPARYQVMIDVHRLATPTEFLEIQAHADTPPKIAQRMKPICNMIVSGGDVPAVYERETLGESVTVYRCTGGRVLIFGFCGRANLLFGPVAMFLQVFDGTADFVVLGDPLQNGFTDGVSGYAPSLEAALERIGQQIDLGRYDEIRTLGTSGGGAAAIAAGRLLGASVMLSFGGRLPTRHSVYGASPGAAAMDELLADKRDSGHAVAIYAEANKKDAENARLLAEVGPIDTAMVRGTGAHNTVFFLLEHGLLATFMARVGMLDRPEPAG